MYLCLKLDCEREREWEAGHTVRDDTFVQKFCQTPLGNTPLAAGAENFLLASFSPQLQQIDERGREDKK